MNMIVVKIGGGKGLNLDGLCQEIANRLRQGERLVLVHGGAETTDELAAALGHPAQYVTSTSGHVSRRTDRRTLEIFEMAYCGQINKGLVERLQGLGVNAVGLSGLDGGLLRGPRKDVLRIVENGRQKVLRDDFTGKVEEVNAGLLSLLLDHGYFPVLTPPALSFNHEAINVDGDRAAAAVAVALRADTLILLTSAPGLLSRFPDEDSLLPRLSLGDLDRAIDYAQGKMKRKVLAAQEALQGGVPTVIIGDGRRAAPMDDALAGAGTRIGDRRPETTCLPRADL
jgi:acetylglutamate/LysW-gamma-L-alpha-aminoadipate kinase